MPGSGAGRDVALVPFVHRGDECREDESKCRPFQRPALKRTFVFLGFDRAESSAPCPEIEKAQNPVANDVSGLASEAVPEFVANRIKWSEQPREERIKIAASVAGRKTCRSTR